MQYIRLKRICCVSDNRLVVYYTETDMWCIFMTAWSWVPSTSWVDPQETTLMLHNSEMNNHCFHCLMQEGKIETVYWGEYVCVMPLIVMQCKFVGAHCLYDTIYYDIMQAQVGKWLEEMHKFTMIILCHFNYVTCTHVVHAIDSISL